jgi:hypothetical protein
MKRRRIGPLTLGIAGQNWSGGAEIWEAIENIRRRGENKVQDM